MDQINFAAWIDRTDVCEGVVSDQAARLIHATIGSSLDSAPAPGAPMPPLWHWYAFPPRAHMEALQGDGHPRLGDFMPPLRLNRRMWAGGNIEFRAPLHVGETLKRRTTIANITEKQTAAGEMVLVNLDHEIHGAQGLAVIERQDIVYLAIPQKFAPPKAIPAPAASDLCEPVDLGTPLLFRYSAITFNAHRIHYDLPYTQEVEKYPNLVVHGPLQAQLLIDMAVRARGSAPKMFAYRGVHPLFVNDQLTRCATKKSASEWALCAVANDTHQTMQANAMWEI
ncbi:MAG: MaoC family dehydratase N-terminal domain-containing protein [Pseudomonadota bacterium]